VALIRRALDTMGRTGDTELTAFTDGCSGLRSILADAGVTSPPILDWFHVSMRLQHAKQAAEGLPADGPDRVQARAAIAAEVERLRWRTWNGKAKDARVTLERIRTLLPAFEGEPARKLKRALDAVDRYLRSQSAHLVDYADQHRAGLRVGTSLTEGTANFLVNRRMAKSQQMRWSRRGADLLLGPLRHLQRRARPRFRPPVRAGSLPAAPVVGGGGITPQSLDTPHPSNRRPAPLVLDTVAEPTVRTHHQSRGQQRTLTVKACRDRFAASRGDVNSVLILLLPTHAAQSRESRLAY